MTIDAHLKTSEEDLTKLADDLDAMQRHIDGQVRRMDGIVDRIEAGWKGGTGKAYRSLHKAASEDAVRIREILVVLEQAVRSSRDGFTEQEMENLRRLRKMESSVDVAAEAAKLQAPDVPAPAGPHSGILDI
ncbi:WXG100 family type VII secretion target [Streptomyces sp. NPDC094032]|uniref:WXG100 family type VII secretion target n=1 Tax=Streptomyces sp. NPDC094032 TaxID=3155308 RepID=UPI00331A3E99